DHGAAHSSGRVLDRHPDLRHNRARQVNNRAQNSTLRGLGHQGQLKDQEHKNDEGDKANSLHRYSLDFRSYILSRNMNGVGESAHRKKITDRFQVCPRRRENSVAQTLSRSNGSGGSLLMVYLNPQLLARESRQEM